mmetsp:Transcript_100214/g.173124  ORF Transcript_100214/g.173124 Transcript_100214/m.173124 type:complete len:441 (-) Transcript_100214:235-1557(-)
MPRLGNIFSKKPQSEAKNGLTEQGTYTYPSGDKYTGQWLNGRKHGYGVAEFVSGNRYEGEWDNDFKHGKGTITFVDGTTYTGDWSKDHKHGHGEAKFASGNRYDGEWVDDAMEGQGTFYYARGDTYNGEWRRGKISGYGVWVSFDGKSKYAGQWEEGLRHGKGTLSEGGKTIDVEYKLGHRIDDAYLEEQKAKEAAPTVESTKREQGQPKQGLKSVSPDEQGYEDDPDFASPDAPSDSEGEPVQPKKKKKKKKNKDMHPHAEDMSPQADQLDQAYPVSSTSPEYLDQEYNEFSSYPEVVHKKKKKKKQQRVHDDIDEMEQEMAFQTGSPFSENDDVASNSFLPAIPRNGLPSTAVQPVSRASFGNISSSNDGPIIPALPQVAEALPLATRTKLPPLSGAPRAPAIDRENSYRRKHSAQSKKGPRASSDFGIEMHDMARQM